MIYPPMPDLPEMPERPRSFLDDFNRVCPKWFPDNTDRRAKRQHRQDGNVVYLGSNNESSEGDAP